MILLTQFEWHVAWELILLATGEGFGWPRDTQTDLHIAS